MDFAYYLSLGLYLIFLGFTFYCIRKENFFKTLALVVGKRWGQQVIFDLYLGLFLFFFFVFLIEKSLMVTFLWLVPALFLGNIVSVLYFLLNFQSIIELFSR